MLKAWAYRHHDVDLIVSILYLRCPLFLFPLAPPDKGVSILYLRCAVVELYLEGGETSFNSLFEMHAADAEGADGERRQRFNSLFEMPKAAARYTRCW